MHTFVAKKDSCFFDICLPNYCSSGCLRKITYFNDLGDPDEKQGGLTEIEYSSTPPVMPVGFEVNEVAYRGNYGF